MPANRHKKDTNEEEFGFEAMHKGVTMLKMGRRGPAHEKLFRLSGDKRYVIWEGRWFSTKLGRKCRGMILFYLTVQVKPDKFLIS